MVRAPGIAPGTADWQTAALLLRHARKQISPCRLWLPASSRIDPMGQKRTPVSDQQPALPIGNGRLDGIRTRITGLKDRHPLVLDDKAEKLKRAAGLAV